MSFTRQGNLKKRYKYGIAAFISFLMLSIALYFIQESLIFRPTQLKLDYQFQFEEPFEEIFLETSKNSKINAIHFKVENPKGVILYFHGNMGDLSRWGMIAEDLVRFNYDVFIIDYRTYGKSTGKLSEKALYEDSQFVYDYLKGKFSEDEIVLYGRSLGTGFATYVASKNSPKQLILETPYHSLTDIAQHRFPLFPVRRLLKYKVPSFTFISKVKCPIYIIHGTDDAVVPFSSGKKLYEAAPAKFTFFTIIEDGDHNNLSNFPKYENWITKALE